MPIPVSPQATADSRELKPGLELVGTPSDFNATWLARYTRRMILVHIEAGEIHRGPFQGP